VKATSLSFIAFFVAMGIAVAIALVGVVHEAQCLRVCLVLERFRALADPAP